MNQQITTDPVIFAKLNDCKKCGALTMHDGEFCYQCSNDYIKKILPDQMVTEDIVNHPSHYKQGGLEVIDILKAKLTKEQFKGYLLGNILKYTFRHEHKGGKEDIKKWIWYSNYYLNNYGK